MFIPLETSDAELIPRTEAGLRYSSRSCSSLRVDSYILGDLRRAYIFDADVVERTVVAAVDIGSVCAVVESRQQATVEAAHLPVARQCAGPESPLTLRSLEEFLLNPQLLGLHAL
ncbi:hypothetical protein Taro_052044 [Colocasia esculenta]|uniref:Uncharacterized protein n=1 Tax=Colocasia esculenta TaxID=4460 RepID=A0A843XHJ4_COLES|nr:hypothetical protein [Colocasia esculenta]